MISRPMSSLRVLISSKALRVLLALVMLAMPAFTAAPAPASPSRVERIQPVLLAMAAQQPDDTVGIIVQKQAGDNQAETLVARLGGRVTHDLYLINAFAAELPARAVSKLAQAASVRHISLDAPVARDEWSGEGQVVIGDSFDAASFNSTGSINWLGFWEEIGENDGPTMGDVAIARFLGGSRQGLRIQNANMGAQRRVDLSQAKSATLSLTYRRKGLADASDYVAIAVSADGGATWTELDRLAGPATDPDVARASYDLSAHLSGSTVIRLLSSSYLGYQDKVYFDDVQIEYAGRAIASAPQQAPPGDDDLNQIQSSGGSAETVRDEFNVIGFAGSNGSGSWANAWQETGEADGPSGGLVRVVNDMHCAADGCLRLGGSGSGAHSASRTVDLSGATAVTLTYDWQLDSFFGYFASNPGRVEVSGNGGATWTTLQTFGMTGSSGLQSVSFDITPYASASTRIRFTTGNAFWINGSAYFDNIQIAYTCTACIDTSNLSETHAQSIGADTLWNEAPYLQGQGVTVAVVDSGIAPHDDLLSSVGATRVIAQVQFAAGSPDDFHGHGTHIAGTIGGNGARSNGNYLGIAPQVNLIDVKVLNDQGAGLTSDVVAGLQWIYEHKDAYDIRVVNMSLNSSVEQSYHDSPLDAAVEILWLKGIVVVVSAGNNGDDPDSGILYPPANDPLVITVGAMDDAETTAINDDALASFSAYGISGDGFAKPDLVAPGRNIISLLASDDTNLAINHPDHLVPGPDSVNYFRMSGTSMASAVTAGAVALLLQDEPNLTPDQVKHRLMATANQSWPGYLPDQAGAGYLDIDAAVHGSTFESANSGVMPHMLLAKMALIAYWASENGGETINWENVNWDSVNWDSVNWDSVNWDSVNWDSVNWDSVNWDSVNWDSVNWDSVNWDSVNWDSVNWDSVNWDSVNWDSVNWDSDYWDD